MGVQHIRGTSVAWLYNLQHTHHQGGAEGLPCTSGQTITFSPHVPPTAPSFCPLWSGFFPIAMEFSDDYPTKPPKASGVYSIPELFSSLAMHASKILTSPETRLKKHPPALIMPAQCKFPQGFFHPNIYPSGTVCLSILNEVGSCLCVYSCILNVGACIRTCTCTWKPGKHENSCKRKMTAVFLPFSGRGLATLHHSEAASAGHPGAARHPQPQQPRTGKAPALCS